MHVLRIWIDTNTATIDELVRATRVVDNNLTTMICDKPEMKQRYPGTEYDLHINTDPIPTVLHTV